MRLRRRLPAWLAILALALHGLWPLIAQAKPRGAPLMVPTCTINGVTHYVELDFGDTPLEQRSGAQHEHCKLCVFGAERAAALPAAAVAVMQVEAPPAACIAAVCAELHSSRPYSPAHPRAPPVRS